MNLVLNGNGGNFFTLPGHTLNNFGTVSIPNSECICDICQITFNNIIMNLVNNQLDVINSSDITFQTCTISMDIVIRLCSQKTINVRNSILASPTAWSNPYWLWADSTCPLTLFSSAFTNINVTTLNKLTITGSTFSSCAVPATAATAVVSNSNFRDSNATALVVSGDVSIYNSAFDRSLATGEI